MSLFGLVLAAAIANPAASPGEAADLAALAKMRVYIGEAFARGDVEAVMACHDDAVEKSFQPGGSRLVGKAAVAAELRKTLSTNRVTFTSNDIESLFIRGDVAVEMTRFAIEGHPNDGGPVWTFRGRTEVVYVRAPQSPCGWSTIRELVQPEN